MYVLIISLTHANALPTTCYNGFCIEGGTCTVGREYRESSPSSGRTFCACFASALDCSVSSNDNDMLCSALKIYNPAITDTSKGTYLWYTDDGGSGCSSTAAQSAVNTYEQIGNFGVSGTSTCTTTNCNDPSKYKVSNRISNQINKLGIKASAVEVVMNYIIYLCINKIYMFVR